MNRCLKKSRKDAGLLAMKFTTETGSTYEVDVVAQKIRRLSGKNDPTPRQGKDGEWREYAYMAPIKIGNHAIIVWGKETELLPGTKAALKAGIVNFAVPMTHTSLVVSID